MTRNLLKLESYTLSTEYIHIYAIKGDLWRVLTPDLIDSINGGVFWFGNALNLDSP